MDSRIRIALAETLGTMIFIAAGPGTAILATGHFFPKGSVGVLGVALAFGFGQLVAIYAVGSISGGHVNPAVTIGMWIIGKTKTRDLPFYILGQLVGGFIAAAVLYVLANSSVVNFSAKATGFAANGYGAHSPGGFKLGAVMLAEVFFTGIFVFVIASTSRKSMAVGFTGLTVGLTLAVIHLITIPVDNTSVNPMRSLVTASFQGGWALHQIWVFIVFPIAGGILGASVWRLLNPPSDEVDADPPAAPELSGAVA